MRTRLRARQLGVSAGLVVGLLVLNFALSFHNVWPTPWIRSQHEVSVELVLLVLVLCLIAEWRGLPGAGLRSVLAAVLTLLALGRYAEVTAPALYGRPVNLYWDLQHIPRVIAMVAQALPWWQVAAAAMALPLLLLALYGVLALALRALWVGLAGPLGRRVTAAASALLVGLYLAGHASERLDTERWFSLPVSATYARQASFLAQALVPGAQALPAPPAVRSDLGRAAGSDVFVIFLESYGAVAFDRPEFAGALAASYEELGEAVAASGHEAVSAFVTSPTFGGASWLAHASLLSGTEIEGPDAYQLLLTTDRPTLVELFRDRGHRALALMPGLRQAWPEGAFYGFEEIYGARELGYQGPELGWWRIPDQFALARLHELEVARAGRKPLFVFFPTISSHMPFRPTPPYQPDWARILSPQPFDAEVLAGALGEEAEWLDLGPAYAATLRYALACLAGYLRHGAPEGALLLVLGDHQPPAGVSGEGASWDVPVHVITRDPELRARLLEAGFTPGLRPRRQPIGPMHELYPLLLRALDAGQSALAQRSAGR